MEIKSKDEKHFFFFGLIFLWKKREGEEAEFYNCHELK